MDECKTTSEVLTVEFEGTTHTTTLSKDLIKAYPLCTFSLYLQDHTQHTPIVLCGATLEEFNEMLMVLEGKAKYATNCRTADLLHEYGFIMKPSIKILESYVLIANAKLKALEGIINSQDRHFFCTAVEEYSQTKEWLCDFKHIVPVQLVTYGDEVLFCAFDQAVPLTDTGNNSSAHFDFDFERLARMTDCECTKVSFYSLTGDRRNHNELYKSWLQAADEASKASALYDLCLAITGNSGPIPVLDKYTVATTRPVYERITLNKLVKGIDKSKINRVKHYNHIVRCCADSRAWEFCEDGPETTLKLCLGFVNMS